MVRDLRGWAVGLMVACAPLETVTAPDPGQACFDGSLEDGTWSVTVSDCFSVSFRELELSCTVLALMELMGTSAADAAE